MDPDVIVVGAGPGGLGAAAELQRRGLRAVVLEAADDIGGTWLTVYSRVRLNTMASLSHPPGARLPREAGRWPGGDAYLAHLRSYARDRRLDVRLGTEVTAIARDGASWRLTTTAGDHLAPQVVLATGRSHAPVLPPWPGRAAFTGGLVHSSAYRDATPYGGRRVLVVGAGNSGGEIAADLVEGGAEVLLAVRTPPYITTRQSGPVPGQVVAIALRRLPAFAGDALMGAAGWLDHRDLARHGLPRPRGGAVTRFRRDGATPLIDSGLIAALRAGVVEVVPAVEDLTPRGARLVDGRELAVDAIVAATGFRPVLEPLVGHLGLLDDRGYPIVHGARSAPEAPGLRFIGYTDPISGNLRELRLDARRTARAVARERRAGAPTACRPLGCCAPAATPT